MGVSRATVCEVPGDMADDGPTIKAILATSNNRGPIVEKAFNKACRSNAIFAGSFRQDLHYRYIANPRPK